VIRVRDWHNGALGISLQAGPGAAESVDSEAPADAARPRFGVAPPPTLADVHDDDGDGVSQWQGSVASAATDTAAWDALFAGGVEGAGAAPMPMGAALPDLATIDRARANFAAVRAPSPLGRDATAGAADGGPMWMTLGAGDIAAALAGATADAGASDAMALDGGAMATALAASTWSGLGAHDDTAWAASRPVATQHASPWSHVLTPPALLRSLT
jgi:hypothetical protein